MKKVYVIGIGPGGVYGMTAAARAALEEAEVICGYTVYLDLIAPLTPGKELRSTPMTRELDRCAMALELANEGRTTAMVCSGDAGVYGMASPLLELAASYPEVDVEVIPGVTAALAGAAALGAPLGHDFCTVSLSDLLTPWQVIEKRLRAAVAGDFVLCLYNPASRRRKDTLRRACSVLLDAGRSPDTPCGWVRSIGRDGQTTCLLTLAQLQEAEADMFTTVFVGASSTWMERGRLITPRGYKK